MVRRIYEGYLRCGSLVELADRLGISGSRIRKYLPLVCLSPSILHRALSGDLPPSLTLQNLLDAAHHLDWQRQARYLRLDSSRTTSPVGV